ncbi:MAG: hypothetical protein JST24_03400, partial [Acidobacteria bacterium]|nr:hypothetical protein [Acidobacteriota bacterium]
MAGMAQAAEGFFQSDSTEKPLRQALLWRLVGYLKPYRKHLALLFLLMAGGAALEVVPAELTVRMINRFIELDSVR